MAQPISVTRFRAELLTGWHKGKNQFDGNHDACNRATCPQRRSPCRAARAASTSPPVSGPSQLLNENLAALATIGERDRTQNHTCPRSMMLCLGGASLAASFRSPSMLRLIAGPTRKRLPMR